VELSARVHALLRRARPADPPVLEGAGIRLDPARREAYRDGRYVPLSRKEFAVLTELLKSAGTRVRQTGRTCGASCHRRRPRAIRSGRGFGLGLSIVRAVANAHGGEVTAVPRTGGGLEVTVRLSTRTATG